MRVCFGKVGGYRIMTVCDSVSEERVDRLGAWTAVDVVVEVGADWEQWVALNGCGPYGTGLSRSHHLPPACGDRRSCWSRRCWTVADAMKGTPP
jgi:hypothetical protein